MQPFYFKYYKWLCGFVDCAHDVFPARKHDIALIVGTSSTLEDDLRKFDSFKVEADVFAVNRAIDVLDRKIDHFVAIDIGRFTSYTDKLKNILAHTINEKYHQFDFVDYYWNFDCRLLRMSGLFAAAIAVAMGYKKIIMVGNSMAADGHVYDNTDTSCYVHRWTAPHNLPFIKHCGKNIRSFSGLTMQSFGLPDKEFILSED